MRLYGQGKYHEKPVKEVDERATPLILGPFTVNSVKEAAHAFGVARQTISRWKNGANIGGNAEFFS